MNQKDMQDRIDVLERQLALSEADARFWQQEYQQALVTIEEMESQLDGPDPFDDED